jgi:CubicO group peptidase (beta-lactamase class C family)
MTSGVTEALPLLDAWTAYTLAQQRTPGLAITVVHGDGPVWSRAFGVADAEAKTRATPQTLFRIGSITKTFTALAVLQLHQDGKLRLDDRVRDHVAKSAMHAAHAGVLDVTIRELLTHSSGLQRDLPGTRWTEPRFPAQIPDHFSATYPSASQWKYSNAGYALLGEVVAAAGGEPWARHVERRILAPLGMSSTVVAPDADDARIATGHSRASPGDPFARAPHMDYGVVGPAASMASTIQDMARWLAFHLGDGGAVLGAKALREMHRPQWLFDDWQSAWSLGMRVRRVDGQVRIGHPGAAPGFAAMMEVVPALKLGVVALTNADDGNPGLYCDYALQLLAPIAARIAARAAPALRAEWERYCGFYRSESGTMAMFVAALDGQLVMVAPGAANPYAARTILEGTEEPHTFIMRAGGGFATLAFGERLTFSVDPAGEVTGYDAASGARFVRPPQQMRIRYAGVDRRRQPQAPYAGVERRGGGDRRGGEIIH